MPQKIKKLILLRRIPEFILKGSIFIAFYFLFFSCAQQSQPLTGGPKDTTPPVMVKSIPPLYDTAVNQKKIIIKFDEFIQLKNIESNFFSSPPFVENPTFTAKHRKLIIRLKDTLRDSVTYNFNFGDAIVDFHEGNSLNNFEFIFSTYDQIDTLQISGQIIDAYTFEPGKNITVMLYSEDKDSLPLVEMPLYATKTDSSGYFTLKNIKEGKYKIFALEDLNGNFIFDKDENEIAFCDSLIIPYFEIDTLIDTLDSGYVYFKNPTDTIPDTLRHDSIVVSHITKFYPDSLQLKLFKQLTQYPQIQNVIRDFKGRIKIFFTRSLPLNYLKIYNDSLPLNNNQLYIESGSGADSVYLWLLDSSLFDNDSLRLIAEYYNDADSLKTIRDTMFFERYDYSTDTTLLNFVTNEKNISIFNDFSLTFETPLKSIDTSKIKLYQKLDTVVTDLKEQSVKSIRFRKDSLIFVFKRPVNNFDVKFKDYNKNAIPFLWRTNNKHDSIFVKITDYELAKQDTLKFKVFYDNEYFFGQMQNLEKDEELPLTHQKLVSIKRPTQDSITIKFIKNISHDYDFKLLDYNQDDYALKIATNFLTIKLFSDQAIDNDTILISYKNPEKKETDTVKAIYVFDRQKITFSRRYSRGNIIIAFHKPLLENPEIKLLSFKTFGNWYSATINSTKDTIHLKITNQRVLRLNQMRLLVSYYDINHHKDTVAFNDSLTLPIEKLRIKNTAEVAKEQKITLQKPVNFKIYRDSALFRTYHINANYQAGESFILQIDSASFVDLFERTNDTANFSFNVYAPEEYAQLNIEIKNIWAITDSSNIDTSAFYQLRQGQLLLFLLDKSGKVVLNTSLNSNQTLKTNYLVPDTYSLVAVYDKNNNGKWDTGDYFRHNQPEKKFFYKSPVSLEQGESKKIIWDFSK